MTSIIQENGEVYVVVDASGLVKVGYSAWAKRRIPLIWTKEKPLQTVIIRRFDNRMARSVEKLTHEFLGIPVWHWSGNSEWFAVEPADAVRAVDKAARRVRRFRRETGSIEKSWTDIRKHWPRRRGVTIKQAVDTINAAIAPRKVSAGWLYHNVKG